MIIPNICGYGHYVPPKIVTNDDMAKHMDTSDEWIRQRTGIEERRFVENGLGPSDLGLEAAKQALKQADLKATDIDCIVFATLSPDIQFPGSAALLQAKLDLPGIPAMDVRCQCSGFLYSLSVAANAIKVGQYKKVLVVGAEVHSVMMDMSTEGRDMAVLFGDGAGAVIVGAAPEGSDSCVIETNLHAQGEFADKLWLEKPGTKGGDWIATDGRQHGSMDGKFVFKHAVTRLNEVVCKTLENCKLSIDDVDHFIFHQANLRINEFVAAKLKIPEHKVYSNIQKYGNCSAASIPILLSETAKDKIKPGDVVCLAAFGSGFTWGCSIIKW